MSTTRKGEGLAEGGGTECPKRKMIWKRKKVEERKNEDTRMTSYSSPPRRKTSQPPPKIMYPLEERKTGERRYFAEIVLTREKGRRGVRRIDLGGGMPVTTTKAMT